MSTTTITIPKKRVGNDIPMDVTLTISGTEVNWNNVSNISAKLYSESQLVDMGNCIVSGVDSEDNTILQVVYPGYLTQYVGKADLIVSGIFEDAIFEYDIVALEFVATASEEGTTTVTVEESSSGIECDIIVTTAEVVQTTGQSRVKVMSQKAVTDAINTGTVTDVKVNGTSVVANKVAAITVPTKTSDLTNDSGFLTEHQSLSAYRTSSAQDTIDATKADASAVTAIENKIPSQATSSNQLADKDFVNSSIQTATAEFKGTWKKGEQGTVFGIYTEDSTALAGFSHTYNIGDSIFYNEDRTYNGYFITLIWDGTAGSMRMTVKGDNTQLYDGTIAVTDEESYVTQTVTIFGRQYTMTLHYDIEWEDELSFTLTTEINEVYRFAKSGAWNRGYYSILSMNLNDYLFYADIDSSGNTVYKRYKAVEDEEEGEYMWEWEYDLNTTGFTAAQWAAVNSGATASNIAAIAGKYTLPSGGIPESDLASAVENRLVKTAVYGTTTYADVKAWLDAGYWVMCKYGEFIFWATEFDSDKVTFLAYESATAIYYILLTSSGWGAQSGRALEDSSRKVTSLSSGSTDTQYPSAKCVYDNLTGKADKVEQIDVANTTASQELAPNTLYVFATRSSDLTLSFGTAVSGIANEYNFKITIDSTTLPTISGLSSVTWNGGSAPSFALGKVYEVSICNGIGVFIEI